MATMTSESTCYPLSELRRRDVLAAGAGLAVLASAPPLRAWHLGAESSNRALAVGYCPGTPSDLTGALPTEGVRAFAAGRLASGDPHLAQGARVVVHGLLGAIDHPRFRHIRSVDLGVRFPLACGDPSGLEVRAWSWEAAPVAQSSPPIQLTVPTSDGLELSLEVEGRETIRYETRLVTSRLPGVPKLRTGLYLIAPDATLFSPQCAAGPDGRPLIAFSVEPLTATAV